MWVAWNKWSSCFGCRPSIKITFCSCVFSNFFLWLFMWVFFAVAEKKDKSGCFQSRNADEEACVGVKIEHSRGRHHFNSLYSHLSAFLFYILHYLFFWWIFRVVLCLLYSRWRWCNVCLMPLPDPHPAMCERCSAETEWRGSSVNASDSQREGHTCWHSKWASRALQSFLD